MNILSDWKKVYNLESGDGKAITAQWTQHRNVGHKVNRVAMEIAWLCCVIIWDSMESIMTWIAWHSTGPGIFVSVLSTAAIKAKNWQPDLPRWPNLPRCNRRQVNTKDRPLQVIIIIIHWTHHLFSDWPKAYGEFSKLSLVTSSSCRLYNNHVKDTQGHG